ncbi:leucine-rich repeat protein [Cohnella hongkongensis]|uniref:Leucine-rich repeat protein n=1 Tax=Cohnella hongkongensis TaxID=178337 RepID=A0ABV9F7Y8_9BACL
MMRRILSLLMLCALLGGSLPLPAAHAETIQDSDFTYVLQLDNTLMITDYSGTSTDVVIPSEFNGKLVTAIGSYAFDQLNNPGQPKLTSVTLPPSVTMISNFAFAHNELTAIEIPSVTSIGRGAFQYNLLQSIVFGEVTFLDEYAFADNQLESVTIPDSLATIGRYAFQNNRLSSVTLPEGLELIDSYAFNGNHLKTLQIPKSVIAIYSGAFMNNSLGDVAIPPEVTLGGSEMHPVFDSKATLYFPKSSVKVFDHAAKYSINIFPCNYNITYDGNGNTGGTAPPNTPYVCYNRVFKVPIPDLDQDPSALTKTGHTFKGWNTKPDGSGMNYSDGNYPIIYGIQAGGFTLYANWEANSYQVSFDTRGGTQIPAQSVAYGGLAPKPEEPARAEYAFVGWYTDPEYTDSWDYDNDTVTEDMTLYAKWKWNGAATIASLALGKDGDHVTGGDSLTVTGVVRDDTGLPVENAVVILRSTLGKWKLTDNSDVSATTDASGGFAVEWTAPSVANPGSVTIYASVDGTIGVADNRTFQVVPPDESNAQLSDLSLGSIALVPEFSGDTYSYTVADVSNVVTSIDVTATTASDQSTLVIDNMSANTSGLPVVSGSPVSVPLHTGMNIIRIDVTAGDGINARTFLIFVRRADTVISGDYVYSLKDDDGTIAIMRYKGADSDVVIPEKIDGYVVTEIGTGAFANLELTGVSIPDTVTNISMNAFSNNLLTAVTLPKDLKSIGYYAFTENQLAQIILPDGLTSVYGHAFEDNRLTSITIPNSVTLVDDYAFFNNLLEDVTFAEDGLQEIGFGAFSDNQLSSIVLPKTLTYLDSEAFKNNKLSQVIMPATLELGSSVFGGTMQTGVKLIFPAEGNSEMVNYALSNGFPFEISDVRIEYDGNANGETEGEAPVDGTHYDYYSSVPIQPSGSLKRTGYTFQGWNTKKDGSGDFYEAGESYKFKLIRGVVKLYAVWESGQFSVSYETNGGTAIPATTANAGTLLDEPTPAPSKEGYRFAGWYKDPSYTTQWNFEQNTVTGDMTLYAKWERKQLAIRLVTSSTVALSGHEISVTGTVYDEGATPQANISVHLSSSGLGKWSQTESDKATVTTDMNGTFQVYWKAPYVFETASVELSATLDGSSAEPATVSIQVSPLPGPNPSSDAGLAGLTLSAGDLDPRFQAGITSYSADVGYATSIVAIVPEVSDQAATVTVNGNVAESGQPVQVNLNVGSNPVAIIVTAEDGTTKTYHVTITRASAPVDTIPVASIKVTSATSSVYVGGTLQMTVTVSPDDATNKQVSWSIQGGSGRAVIDETGLLKAEHAGLVTVQATAQDGSGSVGSQEITIYGRQLGGGDTPTTPSHPNPTTPSDPKAPTVPTTKPSEKPPILNVVPGRPPVDVNDAGAIQTMLDALAVKLGDHRNANVPVFADVENHWAAHSIRLFARLGIVQGYGDGTFKPDASITRGEFASMLAKLFPLAKGTAATPGFTDLGDSWARDAVVTLASNGIINGYEDGTFRADRNITRAEMIAILARVVNLTAVKQLKTVNYRDIDRTWAKDQIQQAAIAGIISGRSKNVFDPDKSATRAEALTVLLRAISLNSEIEQLLERMN